MKLYSVYDNKSKSYGPIFEVAHDTVAIREFGNAVAQERSPLAQYPDDFELHVVGEKAPEFPVPQDDDPFFSWHGSPLRGMVPVLIITARAWLDAQPRKSGIEQLSLLKEG